MAMTWDLSDVPAVETADLAAAMRTLIDNERGLVLLNGLSEDDMSAVQDDLQRRFQGDPQRALAVFVRLRHLVEVFSARRLQAKFLQRGYSLMAPAIAIAAATSAADPLVATLKSNSHAFHDSSRPSNLSMRL